MSIIFSSSKGCLISHEEFINSLYGKLKNTKASYKIARDLFQIVFPFKKPKVNNLKRKSSSNIASTPQLHRLEEMTRHVQELYWVLRPEIQAHLEPTPTEIYNNNNTTLEASRKIYDETNKALITNSLGQNDDGPKYVTLNSYNFVFPENCKFFCKDVVDIERYLVGVKYDLILLDPPWWNKYVRRKRAKTNHGYEMMYNDCLKEIPIENLLDNDGTVVVWCTNSLQHLEELQNYIFHKWNVLFIARWYWLKITQSGEPVCAFSKPPGKQPFEQIIIARRKRDVNFEDGKLIVSVPSALHSHKPPLIELLKPYLGENPKCLELFARYLLPNFTSFGLEATRFQHESVYEASFTTK